MIRTLVIPLTTLAVAACTTAPPQPPCPDVGFINGLHETTSYRGDDDSPANLVYRAEMLRVEGGCLYDETGLRLDLDMVIESTAGPAGGDQPLTLDYFVVTENNLGGLVGSQSFSVTLDPAPDGAVTVAREQIQHRINEADWRRAVAFRVLIGFALDTETAREQYRQTLR